MSTPPPLDSLTHTPFPDTTLVLSNVLVANTLDNLVTTKTVGCEFNIGCTLPEGDWRRLLFVWKNSFVGRYELVNESGAIEPRQPGLELNNSAIPEWTSTLVTDWRRGPWSVAWTVRHIDELTESCGGANGFDICDDSANDINRLPATTYHDLQVSWLSTAWMKGVRVSAGVNNITGKDPPICLSCSLNGYDASTYDLPGRFWYARVGFDFCRRIGRGPVPGTGWSRPSVVRRSALGRDRPYRRNAVAPECAPTVLPASHRFCRSAPWARLPFAGNASRPWGAPTRDGCVAIVGRSPGNPVVSRRA